MDLKVITILFVVLANSDGKALSTDTLASECGGHYGYIRALAEAVLN